MTDPRAKAHRGPGPVGEKPPETETVRPPFDPEEFARDRDSKIRIEAAHPTSPPPPTPRVVPGMTSGTMVAFSSVGPDVVPLLLIARDDLEWFELQPVARALLRHVDGEATIAAIGQLAGVPLDQAMTILHELSREGVLIWQ
jgi:hypothetical protein